MAVLCRAQSVAAAQRGPALQLGGVVVRPSDVHLTA